MFSQRNFNSLDFRSLKVGRGSFRLDRLLRRESLEIATRIITVLLAIISIYILARCVQIIVTTRLDIAKLSNKIESIGADTSAAPPGGEPMEPSVPDLDVLTSKSVFGPLVVANNPTKPPPPITVKDPLVLIGSFLTEGEPPYAIIEDEKRKIQEVFAVGESLFGDGTVKRILVDRVEVERGGQLETLILDQGGAASDDGPPSSTSGDLVVIQETEYTQALENLPLLLTQARAVPYFKDGKAQGLRLFAVKAGSFYERLGLKNGDVLKGINGNSLADLSQAMQLLEKLKSERSFSISVDRNSEARDLRYEIR